MSAAAPSFTPEELPAVTVPGVRNGVFSFDSASSVVSLRGCSSRSTMTGPVLPPGVSTGTISPLKNPRSCAATARCCERKRELVLILALKPGIPRRRSRPSPAWNRRRTASSSADSRSASRSSCRRSRPCAKRPRSPCPARRVRATSISTPPAITRSSSPVLIARAAVPTASRPDAQRRLSVTPGTLSGRPASKSAMRATLRLSSPAWFAQPKKTSSSFDQSTDLLRSNNALIGIAARSSVRTFDSEPA